MRVRRHLPRPGSDPRAELRCQLEREGAVALGLKPLHRQMAHELRGPLNSISLHVALIGRALRGDLAGAAGAEAKQDGWLRAIDDDLGRLSVGLDRWSALLATGEQTPSRLDLGDVVRELSTLLAPYAKRQAVEIEARLPDHPTYVSGPKAHLTRRLASLAAAVMESLASKARLRLELTVNDVDATLEANADPCPDEHRERVEEELVAVLIDALEGSFHAMGGRLEPAGTAGWRASIPLAPDPSKERPER